jgi:hypothetical protein
LTASTSVYNTTRRVFAVDLKKFLLVVTQGIEEYKTVSIPIFFKRETKRPSFGTKTTGATFKDKRPSIASIRANSAPLIPLEWVMKQILMGFIDN